MISGVSWTPSKAADRHSVKSTTTKMHTLFLHTYFHYWKSDNWYSCTRIMLFVFKFSKLSYDFPTQTKFRNVHHRHHDYSIQFICKLTLSLLSLSVAPHDIWLVVVINYNLSTQTFYYINSTQYAVVHIAYRNKYNEFY